jgi:hypothetical protein
MDRRAELQWIADTRRIQKHLAIFLVAVTALALITMIWSKSIGVFGLMIVAITATFGFWITASHISGFHAKLDEISSGARASNR